jgi:hypothetical protein
MREAKINFGFSLENCKCYAKIEIDGMSIPLIKEDSRPTGDSKSHKASSVKNNSFNSIESRSDSTLEELVNIFKKLSLRSGDNESDSSDSDESEIRDPVSSLSKFRREPVCQC